ncbi:MAG TPA: aminotransferase class V-fold PLP-dependent enzyme, partial [Methanocorpusculum sp.]|nr:aminotransferase class V-fold PLP-dependent enzyme [Methanocorpusculum sp.]
MVSASPLIYLNNAATSWPKPPAVSRAVEEALSLPPFGSGRTSGTQGIDYAALARERVAGFLGADGSDQVIFSQNATDALNTLIAGFLAKQTDTPHVLTTALDHNSVLRPLHEFRRAERIGLDVLPFDESGHVSPESVEEAIRPDTRLMVMSHASNVLGSVQDIRAIGEVLQDHGIFFIVDGAQTAGHVPITLRNLPVDAFVFTGHKGLFGIPGTGGFYLRDADAVEPVRFGGTGTNSASLFQPREMPDRFEAGTLNLPGIAGLCAGLDWLEKTGIHRIARHELDLTEQFLAGLNGLKARGLGIEILGKMGREGRTGVVSIRTPGHGLAQTAARLDEAYGIMTRVGLHCAPYAHRTLGTFPEGTIRFSFGWWNRVEQVEAAVEALGR